MKVDLRNLESKHFIERKWCRRKILQMVKNYNCILTELAENYNFFEGIGKQLAKMILEERERKQKMWSDRWHRR